MGKLEDQNNTITVKKFYTMRNLAKKFGFMWYVLAIIPMTTFTGMIGQAIHLDISIIVWIQLPTLALQLFSLLMLIRYSREIF